LKVAINQPTYLPWMGYLDLISQVDLFVILDNVQFVKQSWQQRNRIRGGGGLQWLTVPIVFRGRSGQPIKDVEIRDPEFARDHIRALELAYRRAPYFLQYFPALSQKIHDLRQGPLLNLNLGLIEWALDILEIKTPMVRGSSLNVNGKRTELLANICESVAATQYISPLGSAEYLVAEQNILRERGIDIFFQNYQHPIYPQVFGPFEPFASVIDLIFNCGEQSAQIMRSGRRQPYSTEEVSALDAGIASRPAGSVA
jgi:hypothetical protein